MQSRRTVSDDAVGRSQPNGLLTCEHDQIEALGVDGNRELDAGGDEKTGVCVLEKKGGGESESESHPERTGRRVRQVLDEKREK